MLGIPMSLIISIQQSQFRGGSGGPAGTVWAGPLFTQLSINHLSVQQFS